jgi:hypothetical protein
MELQDILTRLSLEKTRRQQYGKLQLAQQENLIFTGAKTLWRSMSILM